MTKEKNKGFLNGDHSFKNWLRIAWKNLYLQFSIVSLAGMIYQLCNLGYMIEILEDNWAYSIGGGIMTSMGLLVPSAIFIVSTYKGLYQNWNDLRNGRAR